MTGQVGRLVLTVASHPLVRRAITGTGSGRAVASRFVAGETLDDALRVATELLERGRRVSLDHLGEHVTDRRLAETARDDYLAALDRIAGLGSDVNVSVKLTQLGLRIDAELAVAALERICTRAAELGTTVTIDMEESTWTEATIRAFETVQPRHGNLGIAVQAYLYRTRADLDRIVPLGGHVRLCKGAYAESSDVAYPRKRDVDANFDRLLRHLMSRPEIVPAVATHDPERIALARRLGARRESPWEFQMLHGVRRDLQRELVACGLPVRVYLPYGDAWYPYLTRRLAERPSNLAFLARSLVRR